jgi:hypothetical protein
MSNRVSSQASRAKRISELEAENAQLQKTATDLMACVLALQKAVAAGPASPAEWQD